MSALQDAIEQAIADSLDADWQPSWAAKAVMELPEIAHHYALIEALEQVLGLLDAVSSFRPDNYADDDWQDVLNARAVLSLAKGEQA